MEILILKKQNGDLKFGKNILQNEVQYKVEDYIKTNQ